MAFGSALGSGTGVAKSHAFGAGCRIREAVSILVEKSGFLAHGRPSGGGGGLAEG